jgi:hypothetical protein
MFRANWPSSGVCDAGLNEPATVFYFDVNASKIF